MIKRRLTRTVIVVGAAVAFLLGLSAPANAGKLCVDIGLPQPLNDVSVCIPTY